MLWRVGAVRAGGEAGRVGAAIEQYGGEEGMWAGICGGGSVGVVGLCRWRGRNGGGGVGVVSAGGSNRTRRSVGCG